MKISSNQGVQANQLYQRQLEEKKKEGKIQNEEKAAAADSLAISKEAEKIRDAAKAATEMEEVRFDKVEQISNELAEGKYEINSDKIASSMLQKEQD